MSRRGGARGQIGSSIFISNAHAFGIAAKRMVRASTQPSDLVGRCPTLQNSKDTKR